MTAPFLSVAPVHSRPAPAARSRLALLLLPSLVLGLLAFGSAFWAFRIALPLLAPLYWALLLVSFGRMALTAVGPLLGVGAPVAGGAAVAAPRAPGQPGRVRTAILLPVFNEPPEPVAAALRVMADGLDPADDVAFFVLSDTQDPERALHEARLFPPSSTSRSGVRISYRRRVPNSGRKAGNIAAFCREHGADHDFAVVLDADSLMTPDAIRDLIEALRRDPEAALIQSVSYPIGGTTLFARLQQFGARLNTPLSVAGQHRWQGRRGTYWGHNAIIRLQPFMAHAQLPVLPGRPPLGGEILCHDTIEASLLLRAGWDVRLAPEITGSFETTPSNLVDHLARERRWCQGNLQHMRLLGGPGLRPESRVHIGMGILYYLVTPVGLLASLMLLANGYLPAARGAGGAPPRLALDLCLSLTLFMLLAPRLASLGRALLLPGVASAGFGGRVRLVLSVLAEQAVGVLLAPVMALSVTGFVIDTLRGKVVSWNTAARGDRPVGWAEAALRFRVHSLVGCGMTTLLALTRPGLLAWAMPFLLGLVLSIPLARWSGSVRLGRLARRLGLFLTIDELAPLPEQVAASEPAVIGVIRRRPARHPDGIRAAGGK